MITDQLVSSDLLAVIRAWSQIHSIIRCSEKAIRIQEVEKQGTLVSQLLHDMQSVIRLAGSHEKSTELGKRIAYQEKVSDALLFYIREVEIITEEVPVDELILSSLELIHADWKKFNLNISHSVSSIIIDAELFTDALNKVIQNSISATDGQLEKISINVNKSVSHSPFLPFDWIQIEVCDEGEGILPDYYEFIRTPFFTTRKQQGAVGLGLTNAEKIVQAHSGFISITSEPGKGTTVIISLPERLNNG